MVGWKSSLQSVVTLYHGHKRGKRDIVVEGDDWRVGYCVGLCDCLL